MSHVAGSHRGEVYRVSDVVVHQCGVWDWCAAFTELKRCFNCSFPVSGAPTKYPGSGQIIQLNASPFSFVKIPAPVVFFKAGPSTEPDWKFSAMSGHFDGAGSGISFDFYKPSGYPVRIAISATIMKDNGPIANAVNASVIFGFLGAAGGCAGFHRRVSGGEDEAKGLEARWSAAFLRRRPWRSGRLGTASSSVRSVDVDSSRLGEPHPRLLIGGRVLCGGMAGGETSSKSWTARDNCVGCVRMADEAVWNGHVVEFRRGKHLSNIRVTAG